MSDIYSTKHRLDAVQSRLTYFANLSFHIDSIFDEIESLKQVEEVLIVQVQAEEKNRS